MPQRLSSYIDNLTNKTVAVVGSGKYAKSLIDTISHFPFAKICWLVPDINFASNADVLFTGEATQVFTINTSTTQGIEKELEQNKPDFIVLAEDFFDYSLISAVDKVAERNNIKWLFSLIEGWNIDIGPCFVPEQTGSFNCLLQHSTRYHALVNLCETQQVDIKKYQVNALNPAFINIAVGLIANELSDLLGISPINLSKNLTLSLSKQTQIDMSAFQQEVEYTHKCQQCDSCLSNTLTKAS